MKPYLPPLPLLFLAFFFAGPGSGAAEAAPRREEAVFLSDQRRVVVEVPDGFKFESGRDERGLVRVFLTGPGEQVSVQLSFLPDGEGRFGEAYERRRLLHETYGPYVAGSVEKGMHFEELEPKSGAGTFCVFTDSALVGKTELPPGEFHHVTAGAKVWPGVVVLFSVFSQDTKSAPYRTALRLLRESVAEKNPLLR